jgi:hypothetical protein
VSDVKYASLNDPFRVESVSRMRPTKNVQVLLDYLDSRTDPIFWG